MSTLQSTLQGTTYFCAGYYRPQTPTAADAYRPRTPTAADAYRAQTPTGRKHLLAADAHGRWRRPGGWGAAAAAKNICSTTIEFQATIFLTSAI